MVKHFLCVTCDDLRRVPALYRRHTFIKKNRQEGLSDEDCILLDVESSARYENIHLGTVTVEGFGLECWDYEEKFGKPRDQTIFVSHAKMPDLPAKKLLRRLDELRRGIGKFGWNPTQEEADLREFIGNVGYVQKYSNSFFFLTESRPAFTRPANQKVIKVYS